MAVGSWTGVERVGRHDKFCELGGNSLTAMKLTVRTAGTFSVQIPVLSVFKYPSVQTLAGFISEYRRSCPAAIELEETLI